MASDTSRVQMTVRLKSDDKDFFARMAEDCGLEASVAARQILELFVQRMRTGADYVDTLHEVKTVLRSQHQQAA